MSEDELRIEEHIADESDVDSDQVYIDSDSVFVSPSGDAWSRNPSEARGWARRQNILRQRGDATRYAVQRINSSVDARKAIMNDHMLQIAVDTANLEGHRLFGDSFVKTDSVELSAFIAFSRSKYQQMIRKMIFWIRWKNPFTF